MKSIYLTLLIAIGVAAGATGEPWRKDINPALLYFQASQLTPDLSTSERDYLFGRDWRGQTLPVRFGELVSRYNNEFSLVRQAAQSTVACDWGIDWSKGPATLLPHLARNKAVAQAARLRVMWFLQNGRQADAGDDLLAAFALARNSSCDGSLIALLVQIGMENILCSTVAENFYQLAPETLKRLIDGFDAASPRRTVSACIPIEKSSFLDWAVAKIQALRRENPRNDPKVMEGIREFLEALGGGDEGQNDTNRWPRIVAAAGGASDGVVRLIEDATSLYPRLAEILALPRSQYEDQMKQFNAEMQRSPNPLVPELFPAWPKCQMKEYVILTQLAMVRAAVEYKLRGEPGLKSVTDPCGQGPFTFGRFFFEGEDRGFELKAAYDGRGFPEVCIFVDKGGTSFQVNGKNAGQALPKSPLTR